MRTAHILTARLEPARGGVELVTRLGIADMDAAVEWPAGAGVLLGAGGPELDWRRAALIHHSPGPGGGLFAGIDDEGRLFVRDFSSENELLGRSETAVVAVDSIDLRIQITPQRGQVELKLDASAAGTSSDQVKLDAGPFELNRLTGGLALVADAPGADSGAVWFSHLQASGRGLENHEERALGPTPSNSRSARKKVGGTPWASPPW
jgi:hypothetical protein